MIEIKKNMMGIEERWGMKNVKIQACPPCSACLPVCLVWWWDLTPFPFFLPFIR
jgi:hypothetical protein